MTEPAAPEDPPEDLIAIMSFDPEEGIADLEAHIARLGAAMAERGHPFDRHAVRNEIHAATFRRMVASRVLLRASAVGAIAIEVRDA